MFLSLCIRVIFGGNFLKKYHVWHVEIKMYEVWEVKMPLNTNFEGKIVLWEPFTFFQSIKKTLYYIPRISSLVDILNTSLYLGPYCDHPCNRDCTANDHTHMTCHYTFTTRDQYTDEPGRRADGRYRPVLTYNDILPGKIDFRMKFYE